MNIFSEGQNLKSFKSFNFCCSQAASRLPPKPPPGPSPSPHHSQQHNANNQLCGATFAELYLLDGATNATMLTSTKAILGAEIADPTHTSNLWSWVDALHMAMVRPSFR